MLERALLQAEKVEIAGSARQRLAARRENFGRQMCEFVDEAAHRQQKYPAVPEMLVAGQQALHRHRIRLFNEAGDAANMGVDFQFVAHPNVAEPGRRGQGPQPKQDEPTVPAAVTPVDIAARNAA